MKPTGGDVGRDALDIDQLETVDRLGSHRELAEAVGVEPERVRHWWARNNYGLKDLAARDDLRPPLFHIPTAARVLKRRIAGGQ